MLPKKLVYRDLETNQLVTNSYKIYQAFNMREHRQVIKIINRVLDYFGKDVNIKKYFIPTTLIAKNGQNVDGFKITNMGFQKIMLTMGNPRKEDTIRKVNEIHDIIINDFINMSNLINKIYTGGVVYDAGEFINIDDITQSDIDNGLICSKDESLEIFHLLRKVGRL